MYIYNIIYYNVILFVGICQMRNQPAMFYLLLIIFYFHPAPAKLTRHQLNPSQEDWAVKFDEYIGDQVGIEFMPGVYEVQDDIFISNVSNFSIKGDSSSTPNIIVIFQCNNLSSWVIANSS